MQLKSPAAEPDQSQNTTGVRSESRGITANQDIAFVVVILCILRDLLLNFRVPEIKAEKYFQLLSLWITETTNS